MHLSDSFDPLGRDLPRRTEAPVAGRWATRFTIRSDDKALIFQARDVDWFEADGNYVWLHVRNTKHRLRITLRGLLMQLDERQFIRIHKSTVVNVERITEVQPRSGGDYVAILSDGRQLRVSRTFAQNLLRPIA
jgi:two-component system LytT family response regulator